MQEPVDSDWADDKETRQSCSGGAVLFHGCAVLTWARTKNTRALSSAEAELYAIGSGAIEGLGAAKLLQEWQCKTVPLLWTDSQSALAVCKRRGPGRRKHVELKMLAVHQWSKKGTTSSSQSIDSRQSSRPHDQGNDSRETDQVRTRLELTRITLHRLEPTCTAAMTSATSITETLAVEMNTVNSFQHQRLTACGELENNGDEDRDRHVTTAFHLKQY